MNTCPGSIQACGVRVAALDTDGAPLAGTNNLAVSSSLISMEFTPVYSDGEEFEQKNACGDICLAYRDCDRLKRIDTTIDFCTLDPELFELIAQGVVLEDGDAVGYAPVAVGEDVCGNGVSIEVWSKRIIDGAPDPDFLYEWWVFPRVYLRWNARTFNNGPMSHPFTGYGIENQNWLDGPGNDWPVDSDRLWQHLPTNEIPAATCGTQALVAS